MSYRILLGDCIESMLDPDGLPFAEAEAVAHAKFGADRISSFEPIL